MIKKLFIFSMAIFLLSVVFLREPAPASAAEAPGAEANALTGIAGTVVTYPLQNSFTSTSEYAITAGGNNVPVTKYTPHGDHQYYWAHLSASNDVTYVVDAKETINSYEISPRNYGISASKSGTKLTFTVSDSQYLKIKINSKKELYLLIDPLETNAPPSSGSGIYNVTASPYSADKTGNNLATNAIQKAINDANTAGGGTVYIPEGVFLSGPLEMKSNVSLYIKGGAVLLASTDKNLWNEYDDRNVFLKSNGASNIKIFGRGAIYCRGNLLNDNKRTDRAGTIRISSIKLINTNGATIEGISSMESTEWSIAIWTQSQNITVTNTKVLNEKTWAWNDGIDTVGAHHVTVRHSFVTTTDDAACVKSVDYPVYAVLYEDMVVDSTEASGFKFGNQAENDIYDVSARQFQVLNSQRGFNLDHWFGDGRWHDLHVQNFRIEKQTGVVANISKGSYVDVPFRLEIQKRNSSGTDPNPDFNYESGVAGPITDVEISNIQFDTIGINDSYFWGEDNTNKISGINITNLTMAGNLVLNLASGHIQNNGYADGITFKKSVLVPDASAHYKIVNRKSGKALDVKDDSTADGANIVQRTIDGGNSQKWQFIDAGNGYYKIKSIFSGKVMDISGASIAKGAANIQWTDNGGLNQKWQLVDAGGGYYNIKNMNSGWILDISGGSTADEAQDVQWTDNGGTNQQWSLVKVN